jgi:4-hydroxybenzoate polyprenyltransferase
MTAKKFLKHVAGIVCALLALLCVLRIPVAIARLQQADNQQRRNNIASVTSEEAFFLYGTFAGIALWGGVSFYLFRSARKDKT